MEQTTLQLISTLKQENQDFEWYPTTPKILECIVKDIRKIYATCEEKPIYESVLDVGCGDGRSLEALTSGKRYAIEKSTTLISKLDKSIFVVGTDFHQQTLLDKKVDVVFSNPPFSEFVGWTCKILREANSKVFYAVVPERWKNNALIQQELQNRKAEATVLGEFDFSDADRKARGTVNVVRFSLSSMRDGYIGRNTRCRVDPFDGWFTEHFKIGGTTKSGKFTEIDAKREAERNLSQAKSSRELVKGQNVVKMLETFYNKDMEKLMSTYMALADIDPLLLEELDIKIDNVKETLKLKISSLKDVYWHELINKLSTVTNKLASSSRKRLLDKLFASTHVDFSAENAHAVVVWVIKNANSYFDFQLIELVELMTEKANIVNYKSNLKTFGQERWRYRESPSDLSHYKLDYRIVLERVGGISNTSYWHSTTKHGLSDSATNLIDDISTIALNIGYDTEHAPKAKEFEWTSNKKQHFMFKNHSTGEVEELFEAKAFKNGNLHIKLRPDFICKLNVEFGRLKGWLKTKEAASTELNIPLEDVAVAFGSNFKLTSDSSLLLLAAA